MSHAMVNVDVTENAPTVKPSPFSASIGVWIDGDTSLHFRDAGHMGEWLAAACEGLRDLLETPGPQIQVADPRCPSTSAEGRPDRCGLYAHPPRCSSAEDCSIAGLSLHCVGSELPEAQEPVG
jgi:hypothetical protein